MARCVLSGVIIAAGSGGGQGCQRAPRAGSAVIPSVSHLGEGRLGYRSGHYSRSLVTRIGKIELRVPQDRQGRFSTELFERYQRSEKALMAALTEMYIQGVS